MALTASRLELAALLSQPVPLVDVAKFTSTELKQAAAYFDEELLKAEALDSEGWQQHYDDLASDFEDKVMGYAEQLADEEISAAQFKQRMENTIRSFYTQAYQTGASATEGERAYLTEAEQAEIGKQISEEIDYLRGFYEDIKDGMSPEAILARSQMYADGIRSLYFRGLVGRAEDDLYDAYYNSMPGACTECADAESRNPWVPSDCPMPGEICVGYSRCRCEVELRRKDQSDVETAAEPELLKYGAERDGQAVVTKYWYVHGPGGHGGGGRGGRGGGGGGGGHAAAHAPRVHRAPKPVHSTTKPGGGRAGAGSSNFIGRSGKVYNCTQAGEIGEHISEHVTRPLIEKHFGGKYVRISHAEGAGKHGSAGSRTTPWDGRVGKHAFDIKTISASAKSQKAAIKAEEIGRKIADAKANGWTSNIILQRIDHQAGRVDLYLLKGDTEKGYIPSKSWKSKDAIYLGGQSIDVGAFFKVAA